MLEQDCLYEVWSQYFPDETDAAERNLGGPLGDPDETLVHTVDGPVNSQGSGGVDAEHVDEDVPNDVYLTGKPRTFRILLVLQSLLIVFGRKFQINSPPCHGDCPSELI